MNEGVSGKGTLGLGKRLGCKSCGRPEANKETGKCMPCFVRDAVADMKMSVSSSPRRTFIQAAATDDQTGLNAGVQNAPSKVGGATEKKQKKRAPRVHKVKANARVGESRTSRRLKMVQAEKERVSKLKNVCVLCGKSIPPGEMLAHKIKVHKENQEPPALSSHSKGRWGWISVFQGGLPGLGKRN